MKRPPPEVEVAHDESQAVNVVNQTVLRIRRDSDDSLGSELSCSPPSDIEGKAEE